MDPKHAQTYELKALVLGKMEKYDEALVVLEKAHTPGPRSHVSLPAKSPHLWPAGEYESRAGGIQQGQRRGSQKRGHPLLCAEVHQKMGAKDKVLADVDKVLEIKPDLPEAMRSVPAC